MVTAVGATRPRTARPEYAELHLHTAYSFLDGASLPEELVGRAAELGYRWLAVTDHDGLHGAQEFTRAATSAGIAPITGAEITLSDGSHLTLLAESPTGYANLCRLLTAAHHRAVPASAPIREAGGEPDDEWPTLPADRLPRLDPALLPAHAEGLVLLTGCRQGQLARLVDADRPVEAEVLLGQYIQWFGRDNVAVEVQHNLARGDTDRVARLVALAERRRVPYVATGNVHYHRPERHRLQDVLVAIRHRGTLDGTHRERRPNSRYALCPAEEMARRFAAHPRAVRATLDLAERCAGFDLTRDLAYQFPAYMAPDGGTPDTYLAAVCWTVLDDRYPDDHARRAEAVDRLTEELQLIGRRGLAGFFLLHRDLLDLARQVATEVRNEQGRMASVSLAPGRGRGSSVSSIVCYLIGLSPCDPLEHGLSLGRFLNDDAGSVPDIDLDFPRDIREKLIARVHQVYPDRSGLIAAFATYRLRSAVRDVGKALGLPANDLDRIAKLSEPTSARELATQLGHLPEYAACVDSPPWSFLVELAGELAGFPRHVTQHSGGMVISSSPLAAVVPLQPAAMAGRHLIQWDKDGVDDAGMVKIDFLALGMLSLVEECLQLIAAHDPTETPDLTRIAFDDESVYDMICAGDTVGTFQIESRAQIQTLLRTQPRTLEDLTVQVALVRPGPIVGGATTPYMARRIDPAFQPTYDHLLLEPILRDTLGVVIYQDQVVEVARALAGFTTGQADAFRRSISRKRSREAMIGFWHQFQEGAAANGVPRETARTVFRKLLGFSSYGFPKGHAASFAILAYQSAWLKRYYPTEFAAALLNNQPMGFYPPHVVVNDARRSGVAVLPPDINASAVRCGVERAENVRVGLGYVKGLGTGDGQRIVAEREAQGHYRSLPDLLRRVVLPAQAVEALAIAGLFDSLGLARREALWQIGLFIPSRRFGSARHGHSAASDGRDRGRQLALALPIEQDRAVLTPMTDWASMSADYAQTGISSRHHPLALMRPGLPAGTMTAVDLEDLPDRTPVRLAGLVVCRQRPGTAKGVTFLLLEDETGLTNVIVSRQMYEACRQVVRSASFLEVAGQLQKRNRTINLLAWSLRALEASEPRSSARSGKGKQDQLENGAKRDEADLSTIKPESHNYR